MQHITSDDIFKNCSDASGTVCIKAQKHKRKDQHKKLSVIFNIEHEERTECIHGYYFQYIITFKYTVKLNILKSNLSPHFQLLPLAI